MMVQIQQEKWIKHQNRSDVSKSFDSDSKSTKIHQKSTKIVSGPPWVSTGTIWPQKVVPEGGYPPKPTPKTTQKV